MSTPKPIPKSCKYFLGIHFIVGILFGIIFVFFPDWFYNLIAWTERDSVAIRLLGIAIIALSSGSLIAAFEKTWKEIRAIMEIEVLWLLLGTITLISSHIFLGFPILAVFIDVIMIVFLAGFIVCILIIR